MNRVEIYEFDKTYVAVNIYKNNVLIGCTTVACKLLKEGWQSGNATVLKTDDYLRG